MAIKRAEEEKLFLIFFLNSIILEGDVLNMIEQLFCVMLNKKILYHFLSLIHPLLLSRLIKYNNCTLNTLKLLN